MARIIPIKGGFEVWDKGEMVYRGKSVYGANRFLGKRLRG